MFDVEGAIVIWEWGAMAVLGGWVAEFAAKPYPSLARSAWAYLTSAGIFLFGYAALTAVMHRPRFAAVLVVLIMALLTTVSNAKRATLREPFVYQDWEYFVDAFRYPRLYFPFLGWWGALALGGVMVGLLATGIWLEEGGLDAGVWWLLAAELTAAVTAVWWGRRQCLTSVTLDPERDCATLGLVTAMASYQLLAQRAPAAISPFEVLGVRSVGTSAARENRPHLVAVQNECFLDVRRLLAEVRPEILARFETVRAESAATGVVRVPAWGANTVRSEFAFLTGIAEESLGVHRFQPYRALQPGWPQASLPRFLKGLGYRTLCVHPYWGAFYRRRRLMGWLGFDEFWAWEDLGSLPRCGPFVCDLALADWICARLQGSGEPLFVFAITMENHGPYGLEAVQADEWQTYMAAVSDRPEKDAITVYLRHLANADAMIGRLRDGLANLSHPASLCWYGDHPPPLAALGGEATSDYLIWLSERRAAKPTRVVSLSLAQLPVAWMEEIWGLGGTATGEWRGHS